MSNVIHAIIWQMHSFSGHDQSYIGIHRAWFDKSAVDPAPKIWSQMIFQLFIY